MNQSVIGLSLAPVNLQRYISSRLAILVTCLLLILLRGNAQEVSNPDSIISSFNVELEFSRSKRSDTLAIYAQYFQKLISRGNYLQADSIFNYIRVGIDNSKDSTSLLEVYHQRAYMYKVQNRHAKSLKDYLWLKNYYERQGSTAQLIRINNELAEYYRAIGFYEVSKIHLDAAEELFEIEKPNGMLLGYWYSRKSAWFNEALDNQDSVLFYAQKGLEIATNANDIQTQGLLLNEIGYSYMAQDLPEETVMNYFNRARNLFF